jgi:hypothetical protein
MPICKASFSGDWATLELETSCIGQVSVLWISINELLAIAEKAKEYTISELLRREEEPWYNAICVPGELNA